MAIPAFKGKIDHVVTIDYSFYLAVLRLADGQCPVPGVYQRNRHILSGGIIKIALSIQLAHEFHQSAINKQSSLCFRLHSNFVAIDFDHNIRPLSTSLLIPI